MSLSFSIGGATSIGAGVWRASIAPYLVRMLGPGAMSGGAINVLLVSGDPTFDAFGKTLSFPADSTRVLNIGSSTDAVILRDFDPTQSATNSPTRAKLAYPGSDANFLASVPTYMQELANALIAAVRLQLKGELVLREPSGRYVETPDNFWTIKPQPRAQTFRITLRGRPTTFTTPLTFNLKDDRPGYSTFVLSNGKQIADAVRAIREAAAH